LFYSVSRFSILLCYFAWLNKFLQNYFVYLIFLCCAVFPVYFAWIKFYKYISCISLLFFFFLLIIQSLNTATRHREIARDTIFFLFPLLFRIIASRLVCLWKILFLPLLRIKIKMRAIQWLKIGQANNRAMWTARRYSIHRPIFFLLSIIHPVSI
jgi:hypothetical protein